MDPTADPGFDVGGVHLVGGAPNQYLFQDVCDTVRGMSRLLGNAMSALVFALA